MDNIAGQEFNPDDLVASRFTPVLGEDYWGYHEILGLDGQPVHIYCWRPTEERPLWTLVTSGMSWHKMEMPQGREDFDRIELIMTLPGDWPLDEVTSSANEGREGISWPLDLLKMTARLPRSTNSWLSYGSSSQWGESLEETYPGSDFSGFVLGGAVSLDTEFDLLKTQFGGETVHFLGLFPLYAQEIEAYLAGVEVLDLLYEAGFAEGVHPGRPPVA
ncbi:suppressor of fused domain protein [Corynebacterium sp. CCUG 69979]|uniref:suppressor of fused domain protein n=1 Tax=Corynebacterium sp. CCUG 69979 TaxID=2823890 RepID=UPI00210CF3B1|nr:suppressor of fused domain protein [Corynebacterium sp. CCUG 69979]MCQ4625804.1 suppressor of fused domain protein [Corynebacterium sp. CCUG 69979]